MLICRHILIAQHVNTLYHLLFRKNRVTFIGLFMFIKQNNLLKGNMRTVLAVPHHPKKNALASIAMAVD